LRRAAQRFIVCPFFEIPGLEHVGDKPQEPIVVDLFSQYPHHDLVVKGIEAPRNITLDEPSGGGPVLLYDPKSRVATPFGSETRAIAFKL